MNEVFGSLYAESYDALYGDKDYLAECALLTRLFQQYGEGSVRTILDLGCGTGNHALPFAEQGYEVVGVDRSADMIAMARKKAVQARSGTSALFHHGDLRSTNLGRRFDAVLMMFAVLGYHRENADVLAALATAHRHLRRGGLLVFDVWYGPAVLHERPSQRLKVIPIAEGKILRAASASVDSLRHLCTVDYLLWRLGNGRAVTETQETHTMRYFFPREIELFLHSSQLQLLRLGVFPEFDRDPDDTTWNVLAVARSLSNPD